jgi:two-component system NarL family sensor kinase
MTVRRLVVLAVILLGALTGALLAERVAAPSDGAVVQLSNKPWHADRMRIAFVLRPGTGVRPGDVVTGVGPGGTYEIERDGRHLTVPVRRATFPLREFFTANLAAGAVLTALFGMAVFVFLHRPGDRAAQVLLLVTALTGCGTVGWLLGGDATALARHGPTAVQALGELALGLVWGAVMHFMLILPGTRLRLSRRLVVLLYAAPLLCHAGYLVVALPTAAGPVEAWGRIAQSSLAPSTLLPAAAVVLIGVGYRFLPHGAARRRAHWVLIPFFAAVAGFLLIWTVPSLIGWPVPPTNLMPLLFLPAALGIGAAVLRFGWFDIELILRRSLLYAGLSVGILCIFLATTLVAGQVAGPRPGVGVLLASGLVALSAQPLRRWLQHRVGRLLYGERDDPYEVLARLGSIDAAAHPGRVIQQLADTLAQTLRLRYVLIDLGTIRATCGYRLGEVTDRELTNGPEVIGRLLFEVGPGSEPFGPADRRLLDALVRQISDTASAVLLSSRLHAARQRVVLAREEERRQLHHRVHDGLGPALAAIVHQLELAKAQLTDRPGEADRVLAATERAMAEVGDDVRHLIYNLRPADLDQLGLAGAVRDRLAGFAAVVVEDAGDLRGIPAAVEVSALWIAVEAAHNATRHAAGSRCRVRLVRDGDLTVEVIDGGPGLPRPIAPGGGFLSMRERAEEVGGVWTATSLPGGGTLIRAVLPCPDSQAGTGSQVPSGAPAPVPP